MLILIHPSYCRWQHWGSSCCMQPAWCTWYRVSCITLLFINFSITFVKVSRIEIGLKLATSLRFLPLWMGIVRATFRTSGNTHSAIDELKISVMIGENTWTAFLFANTGTQFKLLSLFGSPSIILATSFQLQEMHKKNSELHLPYITLGQYEMQEFYYPILKP